MKAAFIRRTGPPSVIEWGELPAPKPREDEVLVRLKAAAVNPVDAYIRAGQVAMELPSGAGESAVSGAAEAGGRSGARRREVRQGAGPSGRPGKSR